jgi:hypothetical protein
MTTGDPGKSDLTAGPIPQDGKLPQDAPLGQSLGSEPELDAHGVPGQDRRTPGLIYLGMTGCLICAVGSVWLPIMALKYHSARNVPVGLLGLGVGVGALACGLAWMTLNGARKKRYQLGVVSRNILIAGLVVGAISVCIWLGIQGAQTNSS